MSALVMKLRKAIDTRDNKLDALQRRVDQLKHEVIEANMTIEELANYKAKYEELLSQSITVENERDELREVIESLS